MMEKGKRTNGGTVDELLTVNQTAKMIGRGRDVVIEFCNTDGPAHLPHYAQPGKGGKTIRRFRRSEVEAWMEANRA